jgi:alkyl sulfatase BDS1-like metallo-beta-lactamase superfamily hydrolase
MNFNNVKQTLEESFNKEKSADVDIDINVTVLSGEHGKFSVAIHNGDCSITNSHLDKADITVGFINEETMLEMFIQGANPMSLVMGGKMTVNGDLKKGKEIKGLFVN